MEKEEWCVAHASWQQRGTHQVKINILEQYDKEIYG